ncbi:glutathione S-transferase family protein [Pseudoalteromonas sp. NEC-BIFX-2020_015]|uniref:glutathione S-transferase N-terminal domain-containing protein n=1 Tax=Pseudoalteromonas sp. NEC-BIFX-2020_015 TaxID=2729544 RepID=UPI00146169DC|nr:glutathione S-transferase N-terminal domain-containing protein [Pseudoalteromonas sp. NEC-BIFX-2020_015]NMR25350.1 glutathione S-transferase family protein [Pseudoalteromonas sp. NEC-BIFX-2020_015]
MVKLYELAGKNGVIFSPYCWRIRMALSFKGVNFECEEVAFTDIKNISEGQFKTVPVISDNNNVINDSYDIALYLDEAYPDTPLLFPNEDAKQAFRFIEAWSNSLHSDIAQIAIFDIFKKLQDKDKAYFRKSREALFLMSLEDVQESKSAEATSSLLKKLLVLEKYLMRARFVGSLNPTYADFIIFGSLKWLLQTSESFNHHDLPEKAREWYTELSSRYNTPSS